MSSCVSTMSVCKGLHPDPSCMGSPLQACRTVQVHFRNASPEDLVGVVVGYITFLYSPSVSWCKA